MNWDETKGRAKKAVGEVTDDDQLKSEGEFDKFVGHVKDIVNGLADRVRDFLRRR